MGSERRPLDPAEWARVHDEELPGQFSFRRGLEIADEWCTLLVARGETWVDAGSGSGHLTARMMGAGARALGLDRDMAMSCYAAKRWPADARFLVADASAVPLRAGSASGIVAVSLLGYLRHTGAFFDECARVLRRGGWLCVTLTNRHSIPLRLSGVARRLSARGQPVERYFLHDPRVVCAELRRAGFRVARQRLYGRFGVGAAGSAAREREVPPGDRSAVASNVILLARRE